MIKEFIAFILNPAKASVTNFSVIGKVWRTTLLFICLIVVQSVVQFFFLTISSSNQGTQVGEYVENIVYRSGFFYLVFLGPLIEELAFRLPLMEFNSRYLKISSSLIIAILITFIILLALPPTGLDALYMEMVIAIIIYGVLSQVDLSPLRSKWESHYKKIFWVFILLFCLIHLPQLVTFGFDINAILRASISFIVCALFYSFIRIRYGFIYALGIHSMYNFMTISF